MPIQSQEFLTKAGVIEESAKCALFAQVVSRYGKAKLKALGTSMVPAIWPGDTLVVERREALELLAGEVAVYLHQGRLFAHRVIRVAHEPEVFLVTRGDATAGDDPPVLPEEVIGRVVTIVPGPRLAYRVRRAIGALRHALVIRSRRVSP
jgi:signal peptidase I